MKEETERFERLISDLITSEDGRNKILDADGPQDLPPHMRATMDQIGAGLRDVVDSLINLHMRLAFMRLTQAPEEVQDAVHNEILSACMEMGRGTLLSLTNSLAATLATRVLEEFVEKISEEDSSLLQEGLNNLLNGKCACGEPRGHNHEPDTIPNL